MHIILKVCLLYTSLLLTPGSMLFSDETTEQVRVYNQQKGKYEYRKQYILSLIHIWNSYILAACIGSLFFACGSSFSVGRFRPVSYTHLCIKLATTNSPLPFNMWIQLVETAEEECKVKVTIGMDLNPFMKAMVQKPLQEGLEKMVDMLAVIEY